MKGPHTKGFFSVVSSFFALLMSACASTPTAPVRTTIPIPTLRVQAASEITRNGITVTVAAVGIENARLFPAIHRRVRWTANAVQEGVDIRVVRTGDHDLAPLPCFQVRIANRTDHAVRLTQSIFRLEDNTGRSFQPITTAQELQTWNEGAIAVANASAAADPGLLAQVRGGVGALTLLSRSVELLQGDVWTGYAVFNLGTQTMAEQQAFLASIERLTLRLAEIPVALDQAGVPSRTTEFTFVFDKATEMRAVSCPPSTTQPSLDTCS